MKIAFVTFEYPPNIIGGAGIYAQNIAKELVQLGHDVTVFTPIMQTRENNFGSNKLKINEIRLNERFPFKALQFWLHLPNEIKRANHENKFDLIHFNGISYWFFKKKILEIPHVVTIHHLVKSAIKKNDLSLFARFKKIGSENDIFINLIEKRCIGSADYIIAVSDFTKSEILAEYKVDPNKIMTIHNGIDVNVPKIERNELESIKKELNVTGKNIVLFVGRINDPRKGLKFLLRSFREVLKKQNAVLLVVGKGNQQELKETSKKLGIYENVQFTGFVDETNLKKYYLMCDVYVCPSNLEGFGLTLLEAMIAGKPVVATNVGAIPEILINGTNGILVESNDVDALSYAICELLQNKNKAETIGRGNYKYVINNFNWNKCAKGIVNIYNKIK